VKPFEAIAPYYDALMAEIDYAAWVKYVLEITRSFKIKPERILDLACGTGTCAFLFAARGCEVVGIDDSRAMLDVARSKAAARNAGPIFLEGDMRDYEVEGPVDLVTCLYDSLNYLMEDEEIERCFARTYGALRDRGLFVFDMNTEFGLVTLLGDSTQIREDGRVYSIWRNHYDRGRDIAILDLTLFVPDGRLYRRIDETHCERPLSVRDVARVLKRVGFKNVADYRHLTFRRADRRTGRVMIAALKEE
jgi:SAM-dependent methyltransferase